MTEVDKNEVSVNTQNIPQNDAQGANPTIFKLEPGKTIPIGGKIEVSLQKSSVESNSEQAFWSAIRDRTRAIGFKHYENFIERILTSDTDEEFASITLKERNINAFGTPSLRAQRSNIAIFGANGAAAYNLLKTATHAFFLLEMGVTIRGERTKNGTFPNDTNNINENERGVKYTTLSEARKELELYLGSDQLSAPYL